jgi:hypothetical protein
MEMQMETRGVNPPAIETYGSQTSIPRVLTTVPAVRGAKILKNCPRWSRARSQMGNPN